MKTNFMPRIDWKGKTLYRSRAPLRISFVGGGTDVPPFPKERGGCVLSSTIDKYCYATIVPRSDKKITFFSIDYDIVAKYHCKEKLPYNGELDLIKAVLNVMRVDEGMDLFVHSDAPPGSGLGSSSTLVVAIIGAMSHWLNLPLTSYEISELAYKIEREELGILGGLQDQYASTFGGFNFIEFNGRSTIVNPLRVHRETLNELWYNLILCYTGSIRLSAKIIKHQVDSYKRQEPDTINALEDLKKITLKLKDLLLVGNNDDFGALLHEAWMNKKKLDKNISNPMIDEMYSYARREGVLGGKILGAGGGGYLLLYCPFDRKHIVAKGLEKMGGQVVDFNFEKYGLQSWTVNHNNHSS